MLQYIGFEVLTAVLLKSSIFWAATPCSKKLACYLLHACFVHGFFFEAEDKGDMLFRNVA
jgi:hypothetical protein